MTEENTGTGTVEAPTSVVNADGSFTENWTESESYKADAETLSRYKTLPDLTKSLMDTKRKFGKNPDSLIEIPTEHSSDEVKAAFKKANGVPDNVDAYEYTLSDELAVKLGPLQDERMAKIKKFAHEELGLSPAKFTKLLDFYHNDLSGGIDAFGATQLENEQKATVEGNAVLAKTFLDDAANRKLDANAILNKYGMKVIKMPDGSEATIKGMLLEENPKLLTSPYMIMFLDNVRQVLSEDTMKGIRDSSPTTMANTKTQIAEVRSRMDKIIKENPSNFKGNVEFKDLEKRKTELYKQIKS